MMVKWVILKLKDAGDIYEPEMNITLKLTSNKDTWMREGEWSVEDPTGRFKYIANSRTGTFKSGSDDPRVKPGQNQFTTLNFYSDNSTSTLRFYFKNWTMHNLYNSGGPLRIMRPENPHFANLQGPLPQTPHSWNIVAPS